ncbi:hypothetical protein SAICODRAFT_30805 [Saitoella complicata NRRL Y-17804]|uniref:Uncharacterized protein n=1 Tax=Saitoella complicata (strain BCRC 22490 / CBS 7301 / JCM 7358 / NBRC 10748 / NRRL Y-17804) TaxID=698492 RepID=A0A0E9NSL0_SAICN|nr:uncharacterized protein SAICODRAFT_30805 [Saitoella complicata NRRL Y-17804]ODQ52374.1 hypothetical protein SAICODRAFT_30805 [Saitoella complicata NRRL Y-17804]GAO52768.1 hypothetical protein G7K_6836-t1 [Saitoella complicata NRRL Y-17804]
MSTSTSQPLDPSRPPTLTVEQAAELNGLVEAALTLVGTTAGQSGLTQDELALRRSEARDATIAQYLAQRGLPESTDMFALNNPLPTEVTLPTQSPMTQQVPGQQPFGDQHTFTQQPSVSQQVPQQQVPLQQPPSMFVPPMTGAQPIPCNVIFLF